MSLGEPESFALSNSNAPNRYFRQHPPDIEAPAINERE
jgi:hypothetical protein